MPIIKSAKKALRRSRKLNERNDKFKIDMKKSIKNLERAVKSWDKQENIDKLYKNAFSCIDKASRKNLIHKNNAARKKWRIAQMIK